jgi:hypothetical protein
LRPSLSNPNHVTAGGCSRAQDRILITDHAQGLAAATVNAEEDAHERSSITKAISPRRHREQHLSLLIWKAIAKAK